MLSLSKRADYALLALSHLAVTRASDPLRLVNAKELAEQYDLPVELLAKILQTLAKNGIVASHPGPTGGYKLQRPPAEITIAEIIAVLDGPLSHPPVFQRAGRFRASTSAAASSKTPSPEIERRVKNLLLEITLEDVSGTAPLRADRPRFEDFSSRRFAVGLPLG